MIRIKTLLSLVKKELFSHVDTPTTVIALIVFTFLWEFLFFRNAFLVGEASLRNLYDYLPWLLLLFASAVTMGVFAQEKSEGTLELLLTHPVKELEVVLAKFFGSFGLIFVALIFAFPIALTFSQFSPFDWGAFFGQFLASLLLAGSLVSLGLFISSVLTSPIASLLSSAAASFFFIIAGTDLITANLPLPVVPVLERLSLLSHVDSMARGVLDIRDLWYFLSFIIIFLSLTYLMLLKRKFGNRRDYYLSYQIGIFLFIGIAIVSNIVGSRIPGRLDLTQNQKYSLSQSTKSTLQKLPDIVTITFYASSKLPSQLTPVVRDIKDLLLDYSQYGKGNIQIVTKDPSNSPEIASEATQRGVREVQFNVIGQEEFQLKTGYVGVVISYGDQHEAIPLIQQTGDLEYQLTSLIEKLTTKDKKTIAFLSGHSEKSIDSDYKALNTELQKQFSTKTITINDADPFIASDAAVLVVSGPTQPMSEKAKGAILKFLKDGKSALFLLDTYAVSPQMLTATVNQNSLSEFIKTFGITVNNNLVYDLRSNETIRMGQNGVNVLLPYPFWLKALPAKPISSIISRLSGVTFPWTSSLSIDSGVVTKNNETVEKLLVSSPYAGIQSENITISPQTDFSKDNLGEQLLAVSVSGKKQSDSILPGHIIVVGDSDFLTDQYLQNTPQNLAFGLSVLSSLTQSNSLADIQVKQIQSSRLLFRNSYDPEIIRYTNLAIVLIIPGLFVSIRLLRRRSLKHRKFEIYSGIL